ncbi:MAG: J domain-containing protein [Pseudomonadota bacterium]
MSAASRDAIEQALLAYHRAPGKSTLALRQPAVLFDSLKEVLQLASDRAEPLPSPAVQQAAVFFIKSALLAPGADHYALLGLPRNADVAAVKERYRLLMRLLHPDFTATRPAAGWPADAAARVNQAHEVLMSPVQRRAYDENRQQHAPKPVPARPAARAHIVVPALAKAAHKTDPRLLLKRLAAGFGAAGVLAVLASLFTTLQDRPDLVQRASGEADPAHGAASAARPAPAGVAAASMPPAADVPDALRVFAAPPAPDRPAAMVLAALPPAQLPPPLPAARPLAQRAEPVAPAESARPGQPLPPPGAPAAAPLPGLPLNAPPALAAAAPALAAPATAPAARPNPGVTMAEVHPILSRLLQQLESGAGERVIGLLDRDARAAPAAQALLRQYNGLVEGARQVRVANAQFRAEPQEGRLVVIGQVLMQVGDPQAGATPREFAVQAEFVSRDGAVVMTQLGRAQPAAGERKP